MDELIEIRDLFRSKRGPGKLRVGRSTVFRLLQSGELPSVYIRGRRFVTQRQLTAYLERLIDEQNAANPPE